MLWTFVDSAEAFSGHSCLFRYFVVKYIEVFTLGSSTLFFSITAYQPMHSLAFLTACIMGNVWREAINCLIFRQFLQQFQLKLIIFSISQFFANFFLFLEAFQYWFFYSLSIFCGISQARTYFWIVIFFVRW